MKSSFAEVQKEAVKAARQYPMSAVPCDLVAELAGLCRAQEARIESLKPEIQELKQQRAG